jgi:hypothetical protein
MGGVVGWDKGLGGRRGGGGGGGRGGEKGGGGGWGGGRGEGNLEIAGSPRDGFRASVEGRGLGGEQWVGEAK